MNEASDVILDFDLDEFSVLYRKSLLFRKYIIFWSNQLTHSKRSSWPYLRYVIDTANKFLFKIIQFNWIFKVQKCDKGNLLSLHFQCAFAGYLVGSPLFGMLSDVFGRKTVRYTCFNFTWQNIFICFRVPYRQFLKMLFCHNLPDFECTIPCEIL